MKGSRLLVPTVLALLSVTAMCFAQDEGRRGRRGGQGRGGQARGGQTRRFGGGFGFSRTMDKTRLLGSKQVRDELKVSEEQGKKIDAVLAAYREESRGLFTRGGRGSDLSEEERAKAREERTKKVAALQKKTETKLDATLEKKQIRRLNEIVLQQQGIDGLVSDFAVAALKIDKEQLTKIKTAFTKRDEEVRKLFPARGGFRRGGGGRGAGGRPGGGEDVRAKMQELRKSAETAALAALTKEQREGFAKLKGAAFELDRQSLFRGRGGRGAGRGGPGGGEGGGRQRRRPPSDGDVDV